MYKKYILACESGWRGIRELSIDLAGKDIPSTVLIEGLIEKETREMITRHKGIRNLFIPAKIFTPFLFVYVFISSIVFSRRGLSIFLSKEKTYNRVTLFKKIFPHIELAKVYDRK